MRHKPQQERSERMLQRIQEAALDVLAERGTERLTTRHVADAAGISVGTLYHYFADKNDLLRALEQQYIRELMAALQEATPEIVRLDVGSATRKIAEIYHHSLVRDEGRWLVLLRQLLRRGVALTSQVEQVLGQIALQYLSAHPELARVRDFPRVVYILFNACAFNLVRHAENPPPYVSAEALIDGLVSMCEAYVASQQVED